MVRKRLMERNGYSAEEADKRIRSQMTNDERIAKADRVSETDERPAQRLNVSEDQ